jgi:glycosyltransferase involved in cell wall biosynthesis
MSAKRISVALSLADVVVLPFDQPVSMRRGSIVAAICHGSCVVTTGPADEVLVDGKNCILIPNNAPTNIARAVSGLFDKPKLAKLIRFNAKETSKQFNWEEIAKRHDSEYQRLLP